ncbi:MAG: MBL fold metallo-hydrolase [Parabacteroides sp.]|nr:MBL fold metallo-hydrolase [Parabacteroides sp.]
MRLTYIYHSGFAIEADGYSILIDYLKDTGETPDTGYVHDELLHRPGTLYILSTHFHPDHFNPEILKWQETKKDIKYIFSKDILKRRRAKPEDGLFMKKGDVFEDGQICIRAFGSTDVGISFLIEAEGKLLFHAGDLNNWHWKDESTPQEVAKAEGDYLHELDELTKATGHLHLAMFPVDPRIGSDFMRGAKQFVDRIQTDILVPMHFWERPAEVVAFGAYAESKGCRYILLGEPGEGTDF